MICFRLFPIIYKSLFESAASQTQHICYIMYRLARPNTYYRLREMFFCRDEEKLASACQGLASDALVLTVLRMKKGKLSAV